MSQQRDQIKSLELERRELVLGQHASDDQDRVAVEIEKIDAQLETLRNDETRTAIREAFAREERERDQLKSTMFLLDTIAQRFENSNTRDTKKYATRAVRARDAINEMLQLGDER